MKKESNMDIIQLLNSDTPENREEGIRLAATLKTVDMDGEKQDGIASLLEHGSKITSVQFKVGPHTESHLNELMVHLSNTAVPEKDIHVTGNFGNPEWIQARKYAWTMYFEVEEIAAYISECEYGSGLEFSLGEFTLAPQSTLTELAAVLSQLPTGLLISEMNISRGNEGGSIYICHQSPLKSIEFVWEEMYESYSEFDCSDWDQFMKFKKIIAEEGYSLCQGFFSNEWSGDQVNQEEWWFDDFEFPPAKTIEVSWTPS